MSETTAETWAVVDEVLMAAVALAIVERIDRARAAKEVARG